MQIIQFVKLVKKDDSPDDKDGEAVISVIDSSSNATKCTVYTADMPCVFTR